MSARVSQLIIEVRTQCPHCGHKFDAVDADGEVGSTGLLTIITNGCLDEKLRRYEVECPNCDNEFQLGEVQW